ncbi:XRE family transcriptional regulator [Spongiactinospora rosea]|uniref:XRE family transcriptional regulator n=1 Tax=Spongiactinospora rosea TaxID=2248750 RepID=A0A366M4S4_9ACTN|nr:helix-turn-helix transcriptional regulator [Spongiactinospora rosea]RBQ20823.1 XRE family transcriptional regulator [Spongiactinospora rosea]
MSAEPPESLDPAVMRFAAELRRLRREAGLSQARVAHACGCSASLVSSVERGVRIPQPDFAAALDRLFELDVHFVRLARRIAHPQTGSPEWYAHWLDEIEPNAVILRTWDPLLVPGLLQTEAYARAVFLGRFSMPETQVEEQVTARMARQQILSRDAPPDLYVLMDEWVLKRPIGGREVMYGQLLYLAAVARRRRVTLQLVPYDTACTDGLSSSFIIAEGKDAPTTASIDSAGEGEVSAKPEVVSLIIDRYDRLRTQAYSASESLERIEEAVQLWKPET